MPKCEMCGKEADLKEYKIVDDLGTRYRSICAECADTLCTNKASFPSDSNESQSEAPIVQPQVINQKKGRKIKPGVYYIIGLIFLLAALVFYGISINIDYGVANIQATVFAAANYVIANVCFIGGAIIKAIQESNS